METEFSRLKSPVSSSKGKLNDLKLPYVERLALRPWESPLAQRRLNVPPRLLPPHCPVITRWVVLTGATCAGKSTTISALERLGFSVLHEASRKYINHELSKGRSMHQIREDDYHFRHQVVSLALEQEQALLRKAHELIFLDRAALDGVTAHRASGFDPHEILDKLTPYRFDKVLHLTMLPFDDDGYRTRNEDRRIFLDSTIERDYRALGYRPIRIPHGTVEERIEHIKSIVLR